jgi:hypothetical protein
MGAAGPYWQLSGKADKYNGKGQAAKGRRYERRTAGVDRAFRLADGGAAGYAHGAPLWQRSPIPWVQGLE